MRPARSAFLLFVTFLIPIPVAAQQPPQRDPQAMAVLTQALSVMGSAATVQDAVAQGIITYADGRTATITLKNKGADRIRHEVSLDSGLHVMVVSGGRGHVTEGGVTRRLPLWVTGYQRSPHIPALSRMADFAQPNTKVIYVGSESVGGRPAHHIRLSTLPKDKTPTDVEEMISEFHVFIDVQTHLLIKTISFDFSPEIIENRSVAETLYSDYRSVGGLLVPFHSTRYVAGHKFCDITLTDVSLNVGLPDADFQ